MHVAQIRKLLYWSAFVTALMFALFTTSSVGAAPTAAGPASPYHVLEHLLIRAMTTIASGLAVLVLFCKIVEWSLREVARSIGEIADAALSTIRDVRRALAKFRSGSADYVG